MMPLDSTKISRRFNKRRVLFAAGVLPLLFVLTIIGVGALRRRAQVVLMHVSGQISDIELKQVLAYMMPGSDQSMAFLIEKRNPHAVVRSFRTSPADVQTGGQLFLKQCAVCHAQDGSGGPGGPRIVWQKPEDWRQ